MADVDMDTDLDPITSSYDVYIKPQIGDGRQMYILQFPNRDARKPYAKSQDAQPLKMRVKPQTGMVELDVPMNAWQNYDRNKGVKWGTSIQKSNIIKGGGTHGLPGGFGIGGAQPSGRGRGRNIEAEDAEQRRILDDYASAVVRQQVLVKQTLGGQAVPIEETTPQYMIGVFRGNELHFTPVDQIVQMRPQFHHIDAFTEQERFTRVRDPANAPRTQEARAVHLTVKSNVDGEEDRSDSMAERIAAAQSEAWKTYKYVDEESPDAWATFEESLFVRKNDELLPDDNGLPETILESALSNTEYLDTISAPSNPAKLSRSKKKVKRDKKGKGKAKITETGLSESSSSSDGESGPEDGNTA